MSHTDVAEDVMAVRNPAGGRRKVRNASGRVPGPRGMATRERLLNEVARRCRTADYRTLSVAEISQAANTSAATFYHYFRDMSAAVCEVAVARLAGLDDVLALADDVVESGGEIDASRTFVRAFYDFWGDRSALISAIDVGTSNSDPLLADILRRALVSLTVHLGRGVRRHNPTAVAGSLVTMISRCAVTSENFTRDGVTLDELIDSQAHILHDVLRAER